MGAGKGEKAREEGTEVWSNYVNLRRFFHPKFPQAPNLVYEMAVPFITSSVVLGSDRELPCSRMTNDKSRNDKSNQKHSFVVKN